MPTTQNRLFMALSEMTRLIWIILQVSLFFYQIKFSYEQVVDNWGTEEFISTLQSNIYMPIGHNTFYTIDLRSRLETVPDSPNEDGDYILR